MKEFNKIYLRSITEKGFGVVRLWRNGTQELVRDDIETQEEAISISEKMNNETGRNQAATILAKKFTKIELARIVASQMLQRDSAAHVLEAMADKIKECEDKHEMPPL